METSPFAGMDMDKLKALRNLARLDDLSNRNIPATVEHICSRGCGSRLTVEDGIVCRQCVLQDRMK